MTKQATKDAAELAARMARAFPSLGVLWCADKALELCAIERAQRTHAERCGNGPPDVRRKPERGELFGYVKLVPLPHGRSVDDTAPKGMTWTDDHEAQERAAKRIERLVAAWCESVRLDRGLGVGNRLASPAHRPSVSLEGDPRGAVLKVRLPGESEAVAV